VLDAGEPSRWQWLKWNGLKPPGGELSFYVRTGATVAQCTLRSWQGPFAASSTREIDSISIIPYTTAGDRYFQYRVFMAGDNTSSPRRPAVLYDVWVRREPVARDVGVVAINSPAGAVPPGPMVPVATVRNYGVLREPVRVYFDMNCMPPYRDSVLLPGGLPFADTTISFRTWTAIVGSYQARCSTWMATDEVHANDVVRQDFTVNGVDVGVVRIVSPWGTLGKEIVAPAAVVRNFGSGAASFRVWFRISLSGSAAYLDSTWVAGLASGDSASVQFSEWPLPHPAGTYSTRCSTWIALDGNRANDVASGWFEVPEGGGGRWGWIERANLPADPSNKAVKDGAWLAYSAADGLIYAAKGNKVSDFYAYNSITDSWKVLASWPDGREAKKPGKGAIGCTDGEGRVFASKGNNTQGFWMYDPATDSWHQKADVPLGPSNKKVKGGTDIICHDGSVYLLKGYRNEFLKYDAPNDSWITLGPAPLGLSGKNKYYKGSWLASNGAGVVYCHKAKYHELFAYDATQDSWVGRPAGMPLIGMMGKKKKSKDGGCGAWLNDSLYALKGGNTQEFWQYLPAGDSWNELDTMPALGSTGKKKKVKNGGDLVATHANVLYAFKGNKTREFWMYVPYPAVDRRLPAPSRDGVSADVSSIRDCRLSVFPNPTHSGLATLSLTGPAARWSAGPLIVSVYDASGRRVLHSELGIRRSSFPLDLHSMRAGVYIVKLTAGSQASTQKLVLQR
jgi:hypothetical protein